MNKKLAVIDLKVAPLILAMAVIQAFEDKGATSEIDDKEKAAKYLEGPISEELAKLAEEDGNNLSYLDDASDRSAELQAIHADLKRTLSRLDRLGGPREMSRAATMIGDAYMLISPLIQDAKGEAVETEPELPPEEIADMERGPANVHRNAGDGGVDAAPGAITEFNGPGMTQAEVPAGQSNGLNQRTDISRVNPAAQNLSTVNALSLRERAEEAFNVDAGAKNWVQADGKTPLVPFRDLPEEEKALWDAIVLEGDSAKQEALAEEIYATFEGAAEHPWQPGGNSVKQDEARRAALQQLETSK